MVICRVSVLAAPGGLYPRVTDLLELELQLGRSECWPLLSAHLASRVQLRSLAMLRAQTMSTYKVDTPGNNSRRRGSSPRG